MMKKHLVEGVVPVLIELKRALAAQQHWLLGDLLAAIRMLLKDYKNEVTAFGVLTSFVQAQLYECDEQRVRHHPQQPAPCV